MTFCIAGDGEVRDFDANDVDRALCGDCEKPLAWDKSKTADCCGYRYAYWESTVCCHRVKLSEPKP